MEKTMKKTMKKTYTRKHICEAIAYWQKQLKKLNESCKDCELDESDEGGTYLVDFSYWTKVKDQAEVEASSREEAEQAFWAANASYDDDDSRRDIQIDFITKK